MVAYDPMQRVFAAMPGPGSIPLPSLDGQLVLAGSLLTEAADDFGHLVSSAPVAVLAPGSIDDIRKLVIFANAQGIKIGGMSMIGNSHSTYGQSQVAGGVVIDMAALSEIHEITADSALVDAGVRWIELLEETLPLGKSPPTLTDHIDLSVGGTVSVGGIGGQSFRHGLHVDNVLELQIVTGTGRLVTCSPSQHARLFHAARAGMGQFGIIVRARVRLVDVPSMTRVYTAYYSDLVDMTSDQERLIADGRFDYVEGFAEPAPGGVGWIYKIELTKHFDPGSEPDDTAMIGDLSFDTGTQAVVDMPYFDFANRLAPLIAFLQMIGAWTLPHPWIDMFVPGEHANDFIQSVLDQTTLADTGQGPILIYPFDRTKVTAPLMAMPDSDVCYLFSILRTAFPPEAAGAMVSQNRALYEALRDIGGKRYAISSIPFDAQDWMDHFGASWEDLVRAKQQYDPHNVLTPGHGIFID